MSEVIVICGSTRFPTAHELAMMHLSIQGHIVIPCGLMGHHDSPPGAHFLTDDGNEQDSTKQNLDELHLRKIDKATGIYVVNVGGYIGTSTRREIEYAITHGKDVKFMFDDCIPSWLKDYHTPRIVVPPTTVDPDGLIHNPPTTVTSGGYMRTFVGWTVPIKTTPHLDVLMDANQIFEKRNADYKDVWRDYGLRGCLFQLRCEVMRAWRLLYNIDTQSENGVGKKKDILIDIINYAVFAYRNLEDSNRDGHWEYS